MGLRFTDWPSEVLATLRAGAVIPAHLLALNAQRELDPRRQRALTRHYLDAGSGELAAEVPGMIQQHRLAAASTLSYSCNPAAEML